MKKIFFLLLFTISLLSSCAQDSNSVILGVVDYKEVVVGKDVQLVDVRTPQEYKEGFIDDAINIDYMNPKSFNEEFTKLDKNKPLYIYCRSGNRSQKSVPLLKELGFTEIYDLKGGYNTWSNQ
mgnify:CR=1 FL=1